MSDMRKKLMPQKNTCIVNKKYNLIYYAMGRGISLFGTQIYNFALSLLVLKETGSALSFAFSLVISTIPRILFSTLAGILSDRYNRKRLLILSDGLSAMVLFFMVLLPDISEKSLVYIYIGTFLLNTFNTIFDITIYASMNHIFDKNMIQKASSLNEAISSMGYIVAPVLGGVLYPVVGFRVLILINLISFLISIGAESLLKFNIGFTKESGGNLSKEFVDLKKFLKEEPAVLLLYISAIAINISYSFGITVAFPYIVNEVLFFSTARYGILEAVIALGMLAASTVLMFVKLPEKRYFIMISSFAAEGLSILFICMPVLFHGDLDKIFLFYVVVLFFCGFSQTSVTLIVRLYMQKTIPELHKGKIFGTLSTLCLSVNPISILIAGGMMQKINPYVVPLIAGVLFMIITVVLAFNRHIRSI